MILSSRSHSNSTTSKHTHHAAFFTKKCHNDNEKMSETSVSTQSCISPDNLIDDHDPDQSCLSVTNEYSQCTNNTDIDQTEIVDSESRQIVYSSSTQRTSSQSTYSSTNQRSNPDNNSYSTHNHSTQQGAATNNSQHRRQNDDRQPPNNNFSKQTASGMNSEEFRLEKERKSKATNLQNTEYIDPLQCAPRTHLTMIDKVARIVSKFVQDNDRMQSIALQMELQPLSVKNTAPYILQEAQSRMAIHRRQITHCHAAHFHVLVQANLTIEDYFSRLARYFHSSPECFILAFIFIDRAVTMNRDTLNLCSRNIHRLVLAALTLATKFWDDVYYSNSHYARVGGVSTKELDNLEYQLLCLINWKLFVDANEYKGYLRMIDESPLSNTVGPRIK